MDLQFFMISLGYEYLCPIDYKNIDGMDYEFFYSKSDGNKIDLAKVVIYDCNVFEVKQTEKNKDLWHEIYNEIKTDIKNILLPEPDCNLVPGNVFGILHMEGVNGQVVENYRVYFFSGLGYHFMKF